MSEGKWFSPTSVAVETWLWAAEKAANVTFCSWSPPEFRREK